MIVNYVLILIFLSYPFMNMLKKKKKKPKQKKRTKEFVVLRAN
jgi:hypothetical protein